MLNPSHSLPCRSSHLSVVSHRPLQRPLGRLRLHLVPITPARSAAVTPYRPMGDEVPQ